jgi:predicted transcriptional regulator
MSDSNGRGASLYEFRDLDLMHKISAEGSVRTEELAEAIGLTGHNPNVGSRLSWMRRYGMVKRRKDGLWLLTAGGERVVEARLRAAALDELQALPEEAMVATMASVVSRYRLLDAMTAAMLRREFMFGTQR